MVFVTRQAVGKQEQAGSLSHEARIAKLEVEIVALKEQQRAGVPALPSASGAAAVIEQLARERVERELAALVTGQAQEAPVVRKRWWPW